MNMGKMVYAEKKGGGWIKKLEIRIKLQDPNLD